MKSSTEVFFSSSTTKSQTRLHPEAIQIMTWYKPTKRSLIKEGLRKVAHLWNDEFPLYLPLKMRPLAKEICFKPHIVKLLEEDVNCQNKMDATPRLPRRSTIPILFPSKGT